MVSPSELEAPSGRPGLDEIEPLARAALRQYGIVDAELHSLRYYNNATWRVAAADGRKFVLRVTANHHGPARLRSEMLWLRAMQADASLRVPDPVAALDGQLVVLAAAPPVAEPRWCNLFRWREGEHRPEEQMNAAEFAAMGAACARLHRASAAFQPPPGFDRPHWDEEFCLDPGVGDTLARIVAHLRGHFAEASVARFEALFDEARALMARPQPDPGAWGLVHADLHPGNCLFQDDGVAFIDFEDLGWGEYLYDVATALYGSIERTDYAAVTDAFADAYAGHRTLPDDFAHQLHRFQILRTVFLTHLVVTRGDLGESRWWRAYVVGKLRILLGEPR